MLHELRQFISDKQLFRPEEKILLTVSGGIDSVVLFYLFIKAGFSFGVAHCNFSLRGSESNEDESFVLDLASRFNIPFYAKRFDTLAFAKENRLSIQLAARELRYKWFEETADSFKYNYIATAHHLNDVIETSLINLSRGTGIAGLHGIPEKTGRIIRPLLFSDRESIHKYALDNNLTWREDRSNEEEKYTRNLIRNKIVPLLKKLNPGLEETFRQNTERFKGTEALYNFHVNQYKRDLLIEDGNSFRISLAKLDETPEPFVILTEILLSFGFNFTTAKSIYLHRSQHSGKKYYSHDYVIYLDRNSWFIVPNEENDSLEISVSANDNLIQLPEGNLSLRIMDRQFDKLISYSQTTAYFDLDKLKWPLTIRKWRAGDRFHPFGMKGMKKISDFMIDQKIPSHIKKRIPILINGDQIIWLVGYRTDERFKITDSTTKILVCSYHALLKETDCLKEKDF
jgi:tRNA(Ile)-lysidine synthase